MKLIKLSQETIDKTVGMPKSVVYHKDGLGYYTDGLLQILDRTHLVKNDTPYAIIGDNSTIDKLDGYHKVAEDTKAIYYELDTLSVEDLAKKSFCLGAGPEMYVAILK